MTTKLLLAIIGICLFTGSACTKDDDTTDQEPPPGSGSGLGITATKVSQIHLIAYDGINFKQIQLAHQDKTIRSFDLHEDGTAKITFHGKDGRSLLGEYKATTNLANFKIQNGDTVRIVYNNDTTVLITDIWDTYNSGITFTAKSSEPVEASKKRFDEFVKEMGNKKFKAKPIVP